MKLPHTVLFRHSAPQGRPTTCNLASLGGSVNDSANRSLAAATASAASALAASTGDDTALRKLFVRGLAWETTSEKLRAVFSAYGEVEDGTVSYDRATGESRGFGFVTFADVDGANRALQEPTKTIDVSDLPRLPKRMKRLRNMTKRVACDALWPHLHRDAPRGVIWPSKGR